LPGRENENCDVRQHQQLYEFGKETPGTTVETRDGSDILNPKITLKPQKNPADLRPQSKKAKNSLSLTFQFRESVSARKTLAGLKSSKFRADHRLRHRVVATSGRIAKTSLKYYTAKY
jgi:hypothetical protein